MKRRFPAAVLAGGMFISAISGTYITDANASALTADVPPSRVTIPKTVIAVVESVMSDTDLNYAVDQRNKNIPADDIASSGKGDANGDGVFGIADIVRFGKWLLGDNAAEIADLNTLDYNCDGVLDTFDLISMRDALSASLRSDAEPAMMILDYSITEDPETGWGAEFEVRIIDTFGMVHSKYFESGGFFEHEDDPAFWWKEYGMEIMTAGEQEPLITDARHLSAVNMLASRGAELKDTALEEMNFSMCDYGEKILCVFYSTDEGLVPVSIATIGDRSCWLKDKAAQDTIAMMMTNDYYSDEFVIKSYQRMTAG